MPSDAGHPGLLVLFARVRSDSDLRKKVIAVTTRGHYHVEAVFARRHADARFDGGFRYDVDEIPFRFTAMPGAPFKRHEIPDDFFVSDERRWDVVFIPVADVKSRDRAVEWAINNDGVPYNFADALVSPFRPFVRREVHEGADVRGARASALFCSEAVVTMLQIAGGLEGYFDFIIAENITPAVLFDILKTQRKRAPLVPTDAIMVDRGGADESGT